MSVGFSFDVGGPNYLKDKQRPAVLFCCSLYILFIYLFVYLFIYLFVLNKLKQQLHATKKHPLSCPFYNPNMAS